ncbi:hypothetical protein T10_944 [Trichinella papuae]|uniref:Uncharacterized protein n=1 Tax=Trichinella papuae TaxID=268474 RepID=A0A0V1M9T0_9BILA|nr:hypothetical protein T10_944 [Trichinella papuae]
MHKKHQFPSPSVCLQRAIAKVNNLSLQLLCLLYGISPDFVPCLPCWLPESLLCDGYFLLLHLPARDSRIYIYSSIRVFGAVMATLNFSFIEGSD